MKGIHVAGGGFRNSACRGALSGAEAVGIDVMDDALQTRRPAGLGLRCAGWLLSAFAIPPWTAVALDGEVQSCEYEVSLAPIEPCCGCLGAPVNVGWGINDMGFVVGDYRSCATTERYAFLWSGGPDTITLDFPWPTHQTWAYDINNKGQIVGTAEISGIGRRGYFFDGDNFFDLGTLPGGNYSDAAAVNELGQVTGSWGNFVTGDPTGEEAFLWHKGVMTPLGPILGTPKSSGDDINDHGWITGWMGSGFAAGRPFIWTGDKVLELPIASGTIGAISQAISNRGDAAGYFWFEDPDLGEVVVNAALWAQGAFIDLGRLPGSEDCRSTGINDRGEVVGYCTFPRAFTRPFLWRDGVMFDLEALVLHEHEQIQVARAINGLGVVTGDNIGNDTFLAVPLDPPLTDLTGDCATDADDLLILISQWAQKGTADFDRDGVVGFNDLLILLMNWT